MEKQKGYINIDGAIPIFWFGVISIALLVLKGLRNILDLIQNHNAC